MRAFDMPENSNVRPSCPQDELQNVFCQLDIQLLIHELKGPLSVIINNNRMLLELQHRYGRLSESQENALKRALRSMGKIDNLITYLVTFVPMRGWNIKGYSAVDQEEMLIQSILSMLGIHQERETKK